MSTALMRSLSPAETAAVTAIIEQLSAELRLAVPDVDDRVTDDPNIGVVVRGRIARAIANFMRDPSGRLVQQSVGQLTQRWATGTAEGWAGFTAADWAALTPAQPLPNVYTVPLGGA